MEQIWWEYGLGVIYFLRVELDETKRRARFLELRIVDDSPSKPSQSLKENVMRVNPEDEITRVYSVEGLRLSTVGEILHKRMVRVSVNGKTWALSLPMW